MSNLYGYFVNERTVSYISSEYADANNIDLSNPETSTKIKMGIKKALDNTYSLLDKSKVQKNNINDAIEKVVNVTMKRLNLQPRQRNVAVPANMRMPVQHGTNTRMDDSLQSRTDNYLKEYNEFNLNKKPNDVPDWLKSQTTNPKRLIDEQYKNMQPSDMVNKTSTRKNNQVFNDSDANPTQDIEDYGGNVNFSYFNETPEITSAFDDAFYNTGIDPSSINTEVEEPLDSRLKKISTERNSIKTSEQKVENIEELFKNDDAFKKHLNMSNKNYHRTNEPEEQNVNKMMNHTNKNQQLLAQQNRMHPGVMNNAEQYSNKNMQEQYQQQEQQLLTKFGMKEKQYQEHISGMQQKIVKYEEYLKILMQKYNELKEDRDLIKNSSMERFRNTDSATLNAIEEKKAELLRISQGIQEKINRLEQLQQNTQEN